MPQMSPLWWEMLYLMFIMSFILVNISIYYNNQTKNKLSTEMKYKNKKSLIWKW
nr:ATP synthase F0 subunit 8 [Aeschrocoris tuberculatus]